MLKSMSWNSISELNMSSTNIVVGVVFMPVVNVSFAPVSGAGVISLFAIILWLAAIMVVPSVMKMPVIGVRADSFMIPA